MRSEFLAMFIARARASVLIWVLAFGLGSIAPATAATVPPLTSPVIDTTDTLSAPEIARLEAQAFKLQQRSGGQLQILMVASTDGEPIEAYAQRVFDRWKLGREGANDGVLLIVAKNDRKMRIHTGIGLESVVTDATAKRLNEEYLIPKFRRGDFVGGLDDATLVLAALIDGQALPAPTVESSRSTPPALARTQAISEASRGENAGRDIAVFAIVAYVALVVAVLVALLLIVRAMRDARLRVAVGRRPVAWSPEAMIEDPNVLAILDDRVRRERERKLEEARAYAEFERQRSGSQEESTFRFRPTPSGGSGLGGGRSSSGGWSGGGGRSRGGGASGSW